MQHLLLLFQFLIGTVKTFPIVGQVIDLFSFQFLIGTVKTNKHSFTDFGLVRFNSS